MKKILLTATVLATLASHAARAEEFYVELGRAASEAEAKTVWEELQPKHKILANYDVYPNKILQADGSFTFRIQAGPMLDKPEADRVCRRLFRKQVSCFVIEGFDPKNTKTFDTPAPSAPQSGWDFLPWQKPAKAPEIVQAPAAQPVIVEVPPAPAPAVEEKKPQAKAKVDVAEAIPVPVTQEEVTVGAPVAIMSVDDGNAPPIPPLKTQGWLSIQPFLDESRAQQYWIDLKKQSADARLMSARVIHPVVSHDIPKVILAVGPFESEEMATKFCKYYVPSSSYLECQFSSQPPQGSEQAKGAAPTRIADDEYGLFWAQVLSEKSEAALLEKWEKVRTDNDDILGDQRSQVAKPFDKSGSYVVRIGPIKSKSKTSKLCDTLKARKVACSLVSL